MAKVIRTNHTVLLEVTSHGSGGRAEIKVGHGALTDEKTFAAGRFLTSRRFKSHAVGSILVGKVKLSGTRRLIQWVDNDPEVKGTADFLEMYAGDLEKEADYYRTQHGSTKGYKPIVSEDDLASIPMDRVEVPAAEEAEAQEKEEEEAPEISEVDEDWATKIYVSKEDRKLMETVKKLSEKRHVAIMMIGPSGYGKTSIPQQMASEWGMEFLRWDCATVRDPEEFFGFRGAIEGSTMNEAGEPIFTESEFTKKVQEGNAVIVLDELNRIDPYISNILFPLLDHAGKTTILEHEVKVGPNVIFVGTVNLGFQFTGTFTLDAALNNRFTAKVLVNALPEEIEVKILMARGEINYHRAAGIVKLMEGLRKLNKEGELSVDASTRVSIQIAELVGCGLSIKEALVYVVMNGIPEEEQKLVVDQLGFVS